MRLIFLGTSAGMPTAERYPPSAVLELGGRLVLFDCGEGTLMRLRAAELKPFAVEVVCLGHLHGDHVNGLPGLIGALSLRGHGRPLVVCGPVGLADYLDTLRRHQVFYPSFELDVRELDATSSEVFAAPTYRILAAPLQHRVPCMGYRFEELVGPPGLDLAKARDAGVPDGPLLGLLRRGHDVVLRNGKTVRSVDVVVPPSVPRSLAYCSDTAPCNSVGLLAQHANLLVHEATYADKLAELAHARGHSTATDAAHAARAAGVRRLALTHFSPRYKDGRELEAEAQAIFPETVAAADLLSLVVRRPSKAPGAG